MQERLYTLDELVERDLLPPLHPNCRCTITPVMGSVYETPNAAWYDPLLRIPSDVKRMLDAFISAQQARLSEGTLGGVLDWLTLGIVSGFAQGLSDRTGALLETPSLYTITNWLTLGFADEVKGAVSPEQPLSLKHWLHSLSVVSVAYGLHSAGSSAASNYRQVAEFEAIVGNQGGRVGIVLKHQTTSGVTLISNPHKTTIVQGRYDADTKAITEELHIPKNTDFGGKRGGFNVLNTPEEYYTTADQFWTEYNKPFLDAAMKRGDDIVMSTPIRNGTIYTKSGSLTGYGREYKYLCLNGYELISGNMI